MTGFDHFLFRAVHLVSIFHNPFAFVLTADSSRKILVTVLLVS